MGKAAYQALVEFTSVVKANPITSSSVSAPSKPAIDSAAAKLSAAAYPFIKDVDWTSDLFSKPIPGQSAQDVLKAVDKMIVMGAAMDGGALRDAAKAHAKAIEGMDAKGVLSQADFEAINAAIGRMIASVPESTTMDVYNSVGALVDPKVPEYLMSTVKEQDAKAAYQALVEFTSVVKANPITPSSVSAPSKPAIDSAAAKLSAAAYPFIKDVDWTSDLFSKPIPGQSAQDVLKAVDKMIVYNSMAKVIGNSPVPNKLYSTVNPQDAQAAYNALLEFKDVVKAAR